MRTTHLLLLTMAIIGSIVAQNQNTSPFSNLLGDNPFFNRFHSGSGVGNQNSDKKDQKLQINQIQQQQGQQQQGQQQQVQKVEQCQQQKQVNQQVQLTPAEMVAQMKLPVQSVQTKVTTTI